MSDRVELTLRLPANIHARLADHAKANCVSLNQEMVDRLRHTLKLNGEYHPPAHSEEISDIHMRLAWLERRALSDQQGESK